MRELYEYCNKLIPFSAKELDDLSGYFTLQKINKKAHLLQEGETCNFVAFIKSGCIRHYHTREGDEITCDISFENNFITEFNSLNGNVKSTIAFQAMESTDLYIISKAQLYELYQYNIKFERLGRIIAENVAMRNTEIAMALASKKPENRYQKLLKEKPEIFQRIPQKYIANILGIKPESFSRLRKRILRKNES